MVNSAMGIAIPGLAISPNKAQSTSLLSGSTWIVPNGQYLLKLGKQLVAQFFDYNSGLWRTFEAGGQNNPIRVDSDGTNIRVLNISGTIAGANVTTAGTAYTQAGTTISFAAPTAGTPAITATGTPIIGGSLSFTVTTAGTGYTNPVILIPHPVLCGGTAGLCLPATVRCSTLTTNTIAALTTDFAGAGYITAPTANTQTFTPAQYAANTSAILGTNQVVIVDPAGTGAIITPAITNGTPASGGLTGIIMNNNGGGYTGTAIPAITITGPSGNSGTAAATALPWLCLTSVTVGSTNTGYTASVAGMTSGGSSAANNPPKGIYDDVPMVRPGLFMADQSGGVLGTPTITDEGGGFQTVPLAKQIGNATADGSVNATFTAVVGGRSSVLIYQQIG